MDLPVDIAINDSFLENFDPETANSSAQVLKHFCTSPDKKKDSDLRQYSRQQFRRKPECSYYDDDFRSKIAVIAAVTNPRFKMRWSSAFKDTDVQVTAKDTQSWISSIALAFKVSVEPDLTAQEDLEDVFF
ncbi:unnamed protein product [Psylliodes chrysocephalus]|uniref:Uncharacterized protein n=1 Tax=Psylliodes chrysocephalus TaxID=3402493 RepID=A0A9P0CJH7_9CUCU|nr:unnamed protein product [Psylliodes chrysocephala]